MDSEGKNEYHPCGHSLFIPHFYKNGDEQRIHMKSGWLFRYSIPYGEDGHPAALRVTDHLVRGQPSLHLNCQFLTETVWPGFSWVSASHSITGDQGYKRDCQRTPPRRPVKISKNQGSADISKKSATES